MERSWTLVSLLLADVIGRSGSSSILPWKPCLIHDLWNYISSHDSCLGCVASENSFPFSRFRLAYLKNQGFGLDALVALFCYVY